MQEEEEDQKEHDYELDLWTLAPPVGRLPTSLDWATHVANRISTTAALPSYYNL